MTIRFCSVADCDNPLIARGLCSKHYQQWKRKHPNDLLPSVRGIPTIERILANCVEGAGGCWLYQSTLDAKGYVRLRHEGRKTFGHRVTYEFFISVIPAELTFDHLCRRKNCVNPWHGDIVPSQINAARAPGNLGNVNASKTHCPQGHALDGDNLRYASKGYGRVCRTCRAESSRRYRQRKAAA